MISRIKTTPLLLLFIFCAHALWAGNPPYLKFKNSEWVNTQLEQLSLEEKIAQCLMITAYPRQNGASKAKVIKAIKTYKPGGILVMQGGPVKTADWINQFQDASETPLLVAIDGEYGPAMRTDSIIAFPYANALGSVQDSNTIYRVGKGFAAQLKLMGIQMNFAPVADINTNPANPVIGYRSYGGDKHIVAEKAWMVAKGMQDEGVIPIAKHFPGHGDTKKDSHLTLPLITHSKTRIDTLESYPFRYLSDRGISGIMTAHLKIPSLDSTVRTSSLSKKIVTDYLKKEIGFKGFVVSDAINMKGVQTKPGRAEVEALIAGNDMVEFVHDLGATITEVKAAIAKNEITEKQITEKCRTVLALKRWAGLNKYKPADLQALTKKINAPALETTNREAVKQSFVVLTNNNAFPVQNLGEKKIAALNIGERKNSAFNKMLDKYTLVDHFAIDKEATIQTWAALRKKLSNYDLVIAGISGIHNFAFGKYGTTATQRKAVEDLVDGQKSIFVFFGNDYALKYFKNIHKAKGLIVAHQDEPIFQELAAQLVFGALGAKGKLAGTIDSRFKKGDGLQIKSNKCFSYTIPEEAGLDSKILNHKIDSIAELGVSGGAFPGCQVLVAKDGKVVFHKCYGYHTYNKAEPVKQTDIYDWASVTKVTGPLPAIMKLVDEKEINVDDKFSKYWPDFVGTNKDSMSFREVLAHQAALQSWIAFWTMTVTEDGTLDKAVFRHAPCEKFNVRVSKDMYMNKEFRKTMFDTIRSSRLEEKKKYLYSGLSFYLYPDMIKKLTRTDYEKYVKDTFYRPMGAYTITFNAYKHFQMKRIVPTETDDFFRMEKLRGFVHDEGAAMMGGVSGNAGLFGTANDLAKVFQMYLQKGYFGGRRYISEKTINEFTRIQYPENDNRRGLGFDKPLIDNDKNELKDAYPAISCSKNSFGHSGYTGTFAWADPDKGILFIFMSNRVCPTRNNRQLYELNIRPAMHQAIYDSMMY